MTLDFTGQVAVVTGAGGGLGRAHALALAARGAHVVVNDIGGSRDDTSPDSTPNTPAACVVAEITARGGSAVADYADVTDHTQVTAMIGRALTAWGRIDILINNAGILRDASFRNATLDDFRTVVDVHLMGAVNCTKAVWEHMIAQQYGRILMTTSASGIYGNFGQANYGAAKSALVGLMNVLAIEGEPKGIRVNALAPLAATRMTESILDSAAAEALRPEAISPGALFLVSPDAPTKTVLGAGAGVFAVSEMRESRGCFLPDDARTPEDIAAHWPQISDFSRLSSTDSTTAQIRNYVGMQKSTA
ncbi:SDR family NAD(P)-dependent oxidoreductase [Rhodococcus pseudokoreensis]|uniref:SDR family NAD(P)-dependent oxidoreductase n=1 Tax=Rhodococcus pseudokoreensis TaxID=2811421 RepID=A0A974W5P2_9NOCA|nr:SDR family NAD(P)-dependent oxidoreductase [Rhodococcus pseudokoreensis]QSE91723.1 SDR family NAD(P)-dependent oxidoreductase [Rhodococcus pseudokoreensis]